MGCAYFNAHSHENVEYTGRAWFGLPHSGDRQVVDPLRGDVADAVADRLGFAKRGEADFGTSLLLVDASVDVEGLRSSIENWWWPRLLEDGLDIVVFDGSERVEPPRPRARKKLAPFIHCFDMATGRTERRGEQDRVEPFNRMEGLALGTYAFTLLDEDEQEAVPEEWLNRVALIRAPRMVVAYEGFGSISLPSVGVFVADDEADQALKLSEPAAHDRWDPKSKRLDNSDPIKRRQVERIMGRLKDRFKAFANSAMPKPPKGAARLRFIEQLLGSIFRPPQRDHRRPGEVSYDPISIGFSDGPRRLVENEGLRTTGTVKIGLREDAERDEVPIRLEVLCLPVEDDHGTLRDPIRTELTSADTEHQADPSRDGSVLLTLQKGTPAYFSFVTETYEADWSVDIRPQVQEKP